MSIANSSSQLEVSSNSFHVFDKESSTVSRLKHLLCSYCISNVGIEKELKVTSVQKSVDNEFPLILCQEDSTQMMSPMWPQAVRDVPMARLFHLMKHQGLKLKTASLALKVTANTLLINYKKIIACIFF